jgi:hypothetical protein
VTSRSDTTNALLKLTPQQVTDLCEFERFKKWTAELFALRHGVNLSTGYRRLQRLVDVKALEVRAGQPLPRGGSEKDLYAITALGGRMITRLRDRGSDYVTAPDVSNPIDNVHDLCALEVAIRSGCYEDARAFQKRTFDVGRQAITIIPDVEFMSPDGHDLIYIEVEQTSKPAHIKTKYANYAAVMRLWKRPAPLPWLVIVFPDERARRLLCAEHEAIAQAERNRDEEGVFDYNFFWASLVTLRENDVRAFDGEWREDVGGSWYPVKKGLMDCVKDLCFLC